MPNWKKVIVSGSDAALNSLNVSSHFTASGLNYPDTDGTVGQVIITDGAGNLSFAPVENTAIVIKNVSGVTITKGTPCYVTGSGTGGNIAGVWPADAANPARMPAGVIAGETLAHGAEGVGLINGYIGNVNTSAFAAGDSIYVKAGGGYTNVRPTGSTVLIQKLGNVEKSHATNGSGVINGPAYYNEVPNIQQGYTWVGNADGVATAVATSSIQNVISSSFASTASNITPAIANDVDTRVVTANGNGTLNGEGNLTFNGQTLSVLYGVGDEGGEILLGKAATNTTLTGSGVTVDIYQNRLRFFEQGGTARGFYLDISTGGGGASTNLASGGGTVTSVSASGNVSGIVLGGGPITGAGTLTLSGTITGLTNSNLSGTAGITNANLANSSVTVGTTAISLGASSTTLTGLSNVISTNFTGSLFGTASFATNALSASYAPATPAFPYNGDARISGSLGITGSLDVQSWNGISYVNAISMGDVSRNIYDVLGGNSINADDRDLHDSSAVNSLNWETRTLRDDSNIASVRWGTPRLMYDSLSTQSIDWENRKLKIDSTPTGYTVDWYGQILNDQTNNKSIDWKNRWLKDTNGTNVLDYRNSRLLFGTLGNTVLDWRTQLMYDTFTSQSIDWTTRTLSDFNERLAIDWFRRKGYDRTETDSIDWDNRATYDSSNGVSIDWENRALIDTAGQYSVEWLGRGLYDDTGASVIDWNPYATIGAVNHYAYTRDIEKLSSNGELLANYPNYGNQFVPTGEILEGTTIDSGVQDYDLVVLASDGTWYTANMATQDAVRMLGIAYSVGGRNNVLLEGTMVVSSGSNGAPKISTLSIGNPVYMNTTSSGIFLSTNAPVASGQFVRVLGHTYYNSTNDNTWYLMKFRPSNDWIQL